MLCCKGDVGDLCGYFSPKFSSSNKGFFMKVVQSLWFLVIGLVFCGSWSAAGQNRERFRGNRSMSPEEAQYAYSRLADEFPNRLKMVPMGTSDNGHPMAAWSVELDQRDGTEQREGKVRILIMNGIHAGEPCGVDACYDLVGRLCRDDAFAMRSLYDVSLMVIPFYNVDGGNNRSCCSRANQDGPEEYGFRANGRNLDLNRDFIKADARITRNFRRLFRDFEPHVFIDTHTTNGADYPYAMTLISTQADKLGGPMGEFLRKKMEPALYADMDKRGWPMCPYVNTRGQTPETGLVEFLETSRYSTGYAALFDCIGFVTEAHMLKPFEDRVEATYQILASILEFSARNAEEIMAKRTQADELRQKQKKFGLRWELDTLSKTTFKFKGYEAGKKPSDVSGRDRLYYDRSKPWERDIPFWNQYTAKASALCPDFYIISGAWPELLAHFDQVGIQYTTLGNRTEAVVETFHITDFQSVKKPFEGHFLHTSCEVLRVKEAVALLPGDILVSTNQPGRRFLVETLEPEATDSFFAWNVFDSCLQQKEWFSDYVFEDEAARMLASDPDLKREFDKKKKEDERFRESAWAQLYWLYRKSPHFEQTANRLPVYRVSAEELKEIQRR
jgi:hypothetical protein